MEANCAFCRNPIPRLEGWRGKDGRDYCNEWCCEAGEREVPDEEEQV